MTSSETNQPFVHHPVLVDKVTELLSEVPAGLIVDATVGGGGHASEILRARTDINYLGIDRDEAAIRAASLRLEEFGNRVELVRSSFDRIGDIAEGRGAVMGVIFDLGVSSPQLDEVDRGFSYHNDAPLDMRMDQDQALTAADVVNEYSEAELADLIHKNSDEKSARRIASEIVKARPIISTKQLADVVRSAVPMRFRRRGGHPARKTFQAIRMEVNKEIDQIDQALDESVHLLGDGGRLLVIAYHSGEDKVVKEKVRMLTHQPASTVYPVLPIGPEADYRNLGEFVPSAQEINSNPRARSARMRGVEKIRRAG